MNVYTVLLEHVERVKTFGHVCTFEKDLILYFYGQKKVGFFFFFLVIFVLKYDL